ncbi:uncharacterized protein LOC128724950 [Anopheles nili]|uniref:uncharacterized protein LOC128724950 n=1 Tax=Anopheles nili TaxID=185578 RepID=UPI00237B5D5D|nr:uncharacterized protein LOC128724950 [Anopheles nili]
MYRMQTEKRTYFRALLADTFGLVIRLTQWCFSAPYPLHPYQRIKQHSQLKQIRLLRQCTSVVLLILVIAAPIWLYVHYAKLIFGYKIPMSIKLMYYIQTVLQTFGIGYVMLFYSFKNNFHHFYFGRIAYVLEQFGHRNIGEHLNVVRTNIRRLLVGVLLHTVMILIILVVREHSWAILPRAIIFMAGQLMSTSLTLLYVTLFYTIAVLLRQMNDTLEGILNGPALDETSAESCRFLNKPIRSTRDDQRMIEKIRLLQLRLLEVVMRTNGDAFGKLLIAILLTTFIYLNTELLQLYQGMRIGAYSFQAISTKLFNAILKFAMLLLYAYPNRMIQEQNLRALDVLHQLSRTGNDARCNEIINRFITQKNFFLAKGHEAYGMISVDMSLILHIIGGLTSILVVLVQFSDAKPSRT